MPKDSKTLYLRMMNQLAYGPEISEFIHSTESVAAMGEAIANGKPPVTALSAELQAQFPVIENSDQHLMFVGRSIWSALEPLGFIRTKARPPIPNDPLFATGRIYWNGMAPHGMPAAEHEEKFVLELPIELIKKLIGAITRPQAEQLLKLLRLQLAT